MKTFAGLLSIFFLFASCNVVLNPAGEVNNLIKNGSFEENGKPSLKNWFGEDSSNAKLVKDAPERGGSWSVALPTHWFGPIYLFLAQEVKLQSGMHILQFSFWAKNRRTHGTAELVVKTNDDKFIVEKYIVIRDSSWQQYTTLDTVQLQKGEKLYVNLSGGGSEVAGGETNFDLISLTEVSKNK